MWQRFTERARKVIFHAQEEAQNFGEGYVSTEHILLGLTRDPESLAVRVIEKLGVGHARVRAEVEKQLPRGDARGGRDMTLTPRAKRVIDLAYDEARNLNNNYIGTEHLLLGLVRESDGLAGRVLAKLGIRLAATQAAVLEFQSAEPRQQTSFRTGSLIPEPGGHDLTTCAREAALYAVAAAHELGDGQISSEHVLLGILHDSNSAACKILGALEISPDAIRQDVADRVAAFQGDTWTIRWTPRVARILAIAGEIAASADAERLGTGHMLLAVLTEEDGLGAKVLRDHVTDQDRVRIELEQIHGGE